MAAKVAFSTAAACALAFVFATWAEPQEGLNAPPGAVAELKNANGDVVGVMAFTDGYHGLLARLSLTPAAPAGSHAVHLHEVGRCEGPAFQSAGGHFNPEQKTHGFMSVKGPHAGDLPNVHGRADTREFEFFVNAATLRDGAFSVFDADGSAVVMHAGVDDHRTDPDGAAGPRVACGVIAKR